MVSNSIDWAFATAWRSSRSRAVARVYWRLVAVIFIWMLVAVFSIFGVGVVLAAGADPGSRIVSAGWLLTIFVIVPAVMYRLRRRIYAAADGLNEPTFPRPPRAKWAIHARFAGMWWMVTGWFVLVVFVTLGFLAVAVAAGLAFNAGLLDRSWSEWVVPTTCGALGIPTSIWTYRLGYHEELARLKSAIPPPLLRAHQLRDHAQALEDAMHEATVMADELQKIIDGEKQLVAELLKESADAEKVAQIRTDQMDALMARFDREQRRSTIRERWINIATALISLAAGYSLTLLDPDLIKNLFDK